MTDEPAVTVSPMGSEKKPTQRSCVVDLLIILFGVSSWVAVNGLWVELPILVNTLPEHWKLASYIIITTQVANLGPILFSAARKIWSQKVLEIPIIHASLALVIVACVLLSLFWDQTTFIFGAWHSTSLFILTFFLAFVDCTSSLLYLPFIAHFKEQYVISYLVGSGLSGPVPGILALAQGVGGYAECRNISKTTETEFGNLTEYSIEAFYPPPRFSANIFFGVLCGQMLISWLAFILLNHLPAAKRERVSFLPLSLPSNPAIAENFQSSIEKDFSTSLEKSASAEQHLLGKPLLTTFQYAVILFVQAFISTMFNGVLLSIQTYSCLPYGSVAFHLTVTLSNIANPLCCFLAMFLPVTKVWSVTGVAIYASAWAGYILTTALTSPEPPFVHVAFGAYLVVTAWIMVSGSVAYTKACIASILRRAGGQVALYRCGVMTQIGSAVGALVTFSLVQYTTLFKSYDPCS
ncbi:solute carrier family 52, riboflavin transporter, member 3-A isoform X2 [Parasteatoda tepidariorum]|uniref:solute carrier family 52, riboflavin transporter, member 3-A isoform X2 n=1 Tax=Parasteatoda tepidariorum TaxID=114398 RepID=UPI001C71F3A2|nr:solute carrier family 52, riboflavin transporter, member 3-A isoform X2 [Parasteatoda tepidariorum]